MKRVFGFLSSECLSHATQALKHSITLTLLAFAAAGTAALRVAAADTDMGAIAMSSDVPTAPSGIRATNAVTRAASGDACRVTLANGGTLTAALDVEGVAVLGIIEPPASGSYSVDSSVKLTGYGSWPTNNFQAVFWRVGQTTYANVISVIE